MSEPQTPAAVMATLTSPPRGGRSSTSSTDSGRPGSHRTAARMRRGPWGTAGPSPQDAARHSL